MFTNTIQNNILANGTIIEIIVLIGLIVVFFLYKQRLLKKSLQESYELINAAMEAIVLHRDGVCIEANKNAHKMFNRKSKNSLVGLSILDFVAPQSQQYVISQMGKHDTQSYEVVLQRDDKTQFPALILAKYIKTKNARLISIIDITELKQKDKLIAQQAKMASMGEMIGNIAHQWRQPLSIISISATSLKMRKEMDILTNKQLYDACDAINQNAQYLSKTIDDFRNFIQGERMLTTFNIAKSVKSFLSLVEGSKKNNNIEVVLDLDETIEIHGYENELLQCFINIFNNSKDAMSEIDENNRYIFVSVKQLDESNISIEFKDSGGGIPQEILPKIFDPYFTTKHQSKGTGLGLHMTYTLITDGMGGKITASNIIFEYKDHNYKGALFTIVLPKEIQNNTMM